MKLTRGRLVLTLIGGLVVLVMSAFLLAHRHVPGPPCAALAKLGAREEGNRCVVAQLNTAQYEGTLLPDHLTVRGALQIYGQRLDRLPDDLVVEGELFFYKATYPIPADITVSGNIDSYLGFGDDLLRCKDVPSTAKIKGSIRCE
ncbi:MAG TPA: hypothetical protein VFQ61_28510 [Polyangiaceae bacterium]|nr:hypothetical protein [Polyangiaceae bacterium]